MSLLADYEIIECCLGPTPMIQPFSPTSVKKVTQLSLTDDNEVTQRSIISYGLSSFGYDVRLQPKFKLFTNIYGRIIDPKCLDEHTLIDIVPTVDETGTYVILPPNSYLLAPTIEYFDIPRDIMVVALGKSTNARAGIQINVTPIEPGFKGEVVIEVANSTGLPIKIYALEGIAQFLFFQGKPCHTSYGDRNGKYQHQLGITLPKV